MCTPYTRAPHLLLRTHCQVFFGVAVSLLAETADSAELILLSLTSKDTEGTEGFIGCLTQKSRKAQK